MHVTPNHDWLAEPVKSNTFVKHRLQVATHMAKASATFAATAFVSTSLLHCRSCAAWYEDVQSWHAARPLADPFFIQALFWGFADFVFLELKLLRTSH